MITLGSGSVKQETTADQIGTGSIFLTLQFIMIRPGFNISSPEGALVRVLITTVPKHLHDSDPSKYGETGKTSIFLVTFLRTAPLLDCVTNFDFLTLESVFNPFTAKVQFD